MVIRYFNFTIAQAQFYHYLIIVKFKTVIIVDFSTINLNFLIY